MTGYGFWGGFGFWWIFPLLMMLLCFIFMRGCFARWRCFPGHYRAWDGSPLEILQRRYARGEIDQEEYEEKKKHLGEETD